MEKNKNIISSRWQGLSTEALTVPSDLSALVIQGPLSNASTGVKNRQFHLIGESIINLLISFMCALVYQPASFPPLIECMCLSMSWHWLWFGKVRHLCRKVWILALHLPELHTYWCCCVFQCHAVLFLSPAKGVPILANWNECYSSLLKNGHLKRCVISSDLPVMSQSDPPKQSSILERRDVICVLPKSQLNVEAECETEN